MAPPKTEGSPRGTIKSSISNNLVSYTIRAVPLPDNVTRFLLANASTMRTLLSNRATDEKDAGAEAVRQCCRSQWSRIDRRREDLAARTVRPELFWKTLETILSKAGGEWKDKKRKQALIDASPTDLKTSLRFSSPIASSLRQRSETRRQHQSGLPTPSTSENNGIDSATLAAANLSLAEDPNASKKYGFSISDLSESIDNGFQMAMQQGPMCAEPVQGMAYYVEKIDVNAEEADKEGARSRLSQVTGSLISSVREACRNGLLDWFSRLMLAMYSCDIQLLVSISVQAEVLGKVHGVLAKRRGRITSEEMQEGTAFFTVGSLLPVVESFGFADEIRTRTSGAASPQLIFKGESKTEKDVEEPIANHRS
ncbi:hypothetical protein L7F22_009691 [Adiantum nelumboides]|nr:hypothetical protein [Adiantum nelumboides]